MYLLSDLEDNRTEQATGIAKFKDILTMEKESNAIAKRLISSPCKGRKARLAPIPKTPASPIPHAAQPGTSNPRNIAIVAKNPIDFSEARICITLYARRLTRTPVKMLIIQSMITEEGKIVL